MIDSNWPLVHMYQENVRLGNVPAVVCPNDDSDMHSVSVGKDLEPGLRCPDCSTTYKLGLDILDQMNRNLNELLDLQEAAPQPRRTGYGTGPR